MEKMESFIPMPRTVAQDEIIEIIEMKKNIEKLEEAVGFLVKKLRELEKEFKDHGKYYNHERISTLYD